VCFIFCGPSWIHRIFAFGCFSRLHSHQSRGGSFILFFALKSVLLNHKGQEKFPANFLLILSREG
jgi:hypothetical protein